MLYDKLDGDKLQRIILAYNRLIDDEAERAASLTAKRIRRRPTRKR